MTGVRSEAFDRVVACLEMAEKPLCGRSEQNSQARFVFRFERTEHLALCPSILNIPQREGNKKDANSPSCCLVVGPLASLL